MFFHLEMSAGKIIHYPCYMHIQVCNTTATATTIFMPRLLSDFLLVMVMQFLENVRSPVRSENHMCSHPHTGDATSLYFTTKSLAHQISCNFFCEFFCYHITCTRVATHAIFHHALATIIFLKKLYHRYKQKITHVTTAFLIHLFT